MLLFTRSKVFHFPRRKQKSFQFLNQETVRSLRTQDQFHYCLFYLKYAKGQLTHSSLTARLLDSCNVIHQMQSGNRKFHSTESALLHFTSLTNCSITWIKGRCLSSFFWTCPKLLTAFDMTWCCANFAIPVYRNLRVPSLIAICYNVNKLLRFRIPCPALYP